MPCLSLIHILNGGIPLGGDLKNIGSKTLYLSSRDGGTKVAVVFDSGGGHLINLSNSNNSKLSKEEKTDVQLAAEARKSNEISAEEFLEIIKMSGDSLAVLMVSDYSYRNPFQLLSYADPNESEKSDRLKFNADMAIGWMTKTDGNLNIVLNIRDLDYDNGGAMTTKELQSNKEKVQQRIELQWTCLLYTSRCV